MIGRSDSELGCFTAHTHIRPTALPGRL